MYAITYLPRRSPMQPQLLPAPLRDDVPGCGPVPRLTAQTVVTTMRHAINRQAWTVHGGRASVWYERHVRGR